MVMAAWPSQTMLWRNSSQNKFIEPLPNTETYKNSSFCRTVKDWNELPSKIFNIKSADRFKKVLFEYFSQWWILVLHNDWCCEINYFNYYYYYYYFIHFIFYRKFLNVNTLNFLSFYLGISCNGNPVAGLQIFELRLNKGL